MGTVIAKITLTNLEDTIRLKDGSIKERDVHTETIDMKADTGAFAELVIDEATCARLALGIVGTKTARAVGNMPIECKITEPLYAQWKNRWIVCNAFVVPKQKDMLLGVIAMEKLDVKVNPISGELEGIHGDEPVAVLD